MLKIFHAQGARSLRVLWLCEEMGVPYETAEASFFKPSDEFKAVNPLRTVPAMTDGDVRMIESVAMMIYIMAKHGPTDLDVKPDEPGYADYLQYLMFGEAGIAADRSREGARSREWASHGTSIRDSGRKVGRTPAGPPCRRGAAGHGETRVPRRGHSRKSRGPSDNRLPTERALDGSGGRPHDARSIQVSQCRSVVVFRPP